LSNLLLSYYLLVPPYIFLVSKPSSKSTGFRIKLFDYYIKYASLILVVVNISAFIYSQFIVDMNSHNHEDVFTGLYGASGLGAHSLSIINLCFSAYYLYKKAYWKFLFFLLCGVLGFYGLGLMIFVLTFLVMYSSRLLRYWKAIISMLIVGAAVIIFIKKFNAQNLNYIEKNLSKAALVFEDYNYDGEIQKSRDMQITEIPRFITFMDGARKRFFGEIKVFLLGASPGSYNSRTAFYLNGDFVSNKFIKTHFNNRTEYHKEDIYPLLNWELLKKPYNDGTRNQVFSSIIAIFLEYGFLVGGFFLLSFFFKIGQIQKETINHEKKEYLKFLGVFILLLLFFQNYMEYPEILLPMILSIKLLEVDAAKSKPDFENA